MPISVLRYVVDKVKLLEIVKKGEKYEGYYLLEVFLIGGNLTELCLYMYFTYDSFIDRHKKG